MADKNNVPAELLERVDRARLQTVARQPISVITQMRGARPIGRLLTDEERELIRRAESRRLARFIGI